MVTKTAIEVALEALNVTDSRDTIYNAVEIRRAIDVLEQEHAQIVARENNFYAAQDRPYA